MRLKALILIYIIMIQVASVLKAERPIISIESSYFGAEELTQLKKELNLTVGEKFNSSRLNEAIIRLYAKGKIRTLFVEMVPTEKGVKLILSGSRQTRIRALEYINVDAEIIEEVSSTVPQPNDLFDPRKIALLKERLASAYEARGFYSPQIEVSLEPAPGNETLVKIKANPGPETFVSRVTLSGATPEENQKVLSLFPLKKGNRFSRALLEDAISKLGVGLKQSQYLTARIEDANLVFSEGATRVEITLFVKLGEKLQFEFTGHTVFEEPQLRVLFTEEILLQGDGPKRIAGLIENKYRSIGYHFVKVKVDKILDEEKRLSIFRFHLTEGGKVRVDAVRFSGSSEVGEDLLREMFFDQAPGVLKRKLYWDDGIESATSALKEKLDAMGYISLQLTGPRTLFSADRKGVDLEFDLELGVKTSIRKIRVVGVNYFPEEIVKATLGINEQMPFDRKQLQAGKQAVLTKLYRSAGFLDADWDGVDSVEYSSDRKWVDITLKIREATQYRVGIINLMGNKRTQSRVILRELKLASSDIYNPVLVQQSEDDIAATGLFSKVEIQSNPSSTEVDRKDLTISVRESQPGLGEVGLGAVYEDPRLRPRAFLGLGYKNLFGLNHTASIRSELSLPLSRDKLIPFIEYSTILGYRAPFPFEVPITYTTQIGLDSFEVATKGPQIQTRARIDNKIEKRLSETVTGIYRIHRYERTTTEWLDNSESVKRDVIGSTGPGLIVDFRNNVFNPTKGSYHILDVELGHPVLLSREDTAFIMVINRNSFYLPLFESSGFAFYGGLGYAQSLFDNKSLPTARLTSNLALGGRGSIRGFNPGESQPPSSTNTSAFYNLRAEFSAQLFSEDWSGALFFDTGQIYPELRPGPRLDGVGFGVRYKTPVGPVVIDIAQGLGKAQPKFYFTVGTI